jgi:ribosomal protein L14
MAEFTEAFKKISCENLAKNLEEKGGYHTLEELGSMEVDVRSALERKWREGDKEFPYGTPGEIARAVQYWKDWKAQRDGVPNDANPNDCELSKALLDISRDLRQIAVILVNRKRYTTFASLGSTADQATTTVKDAVGTGYAKPGEITQVVQAWKTWKETQGAVGKDENPNDCELSKALLNISRDLREIAVILVNRKRYTTFASLGSTADQVTTTVKDAVGTEYKRPGDVGQVVEAWKAAQKKTGTILDLPESALADQKLDLTAPKITISDVKWEVPNHFPAVKGDGKFKASGELTKLEWLPIAKRTGVLFALDIASALREKSKGQAAPILAQKPAFYWKVNVPTASDFSRPLDWDGDTLEELSYTESACSLVHNKMTAGALSIATPFCAASLEASREEKNAKSTKSKNLHLSGTSRIIYAKLDMNNCLALRDEVIKEIDNALTKPTIAEKAKALQAVFDDYGYFSPLGPWTEPRRNNM